MPSYEIEADGKTYDVDAPSMPAALEAFRGFRGNASTGIPQSQGDVSLGADNLVRSMAHGVPIIGGLTDKFAAGMDALTNPVLGRGASDGTLAERYAKNLEAESVHSQAFNDAHPVASTAAELTGGVAGFGAAARIPGVAYGLGMTGGPMVAKVIRGGLSGAAIGGADAATRGNDVGAGTGVGLITGGLAAPVGRAVGAAYEGVANRIGRPTYAGSATGALERAIGDDALTPLTMRSQAADLGPNGMLADMGPNLRSQAEAIAAQPGPGQKIVTDAMTSRNDLAGARITDAADNVLGSRINPTQLADDIISRRQAQAAPLYDAAYQTPINLTPDLKAVLATPAGKAALNRAGKLSANETGAPQGMFAKSSPPPLPSGNLSAGQYQDWLRAQAVPSSGLHSVDVRGLDLTKRVLDDMADAASRAGRNNEARIIGGLRNTLLKEVDRQAPSYRAARDVFSTESGIRDALENGRSIFSRSIAPDELGKMLSGMTAGEREAFTHGTRAAVADIMGSARNDAQAARALFQKGWTREKLGMVIGAGPTDQLIQSLNRESTFAATGQGVLGNSRTAARTAASKEFPNVVDDPPIPHGVTALDAALYVPRKAAGALGGAALRARAAEQSGAAGTALTASGQQLQDLIRQIEVAQQLRAANSLRAGGVAHAANIATMVLPPADRRGAK